MNGNDVAISNELVKTEETKALSREGDMYSRLKYMVTNGKKLSNDECAALAQFAVVEGLNPFAQECWYIPGVGPSIGIAGLRKKATQALGPDYTWNVQFKDVTDDYRNIEDRVIKYAFEATLRDTKSMGHYMAAYKEAKEIFATAEEIINVVGRPPIWQAVGTFLEDQADKYKDKFFIQKERAKKRAEALVIKKRFSLSYEYGDADYDQDDAITIGFEKEPNNNETIEGEIVESEPTKASKTPQNEDSKQEKLKPGWTSEQIAMLVEIYPDVHPTELVNRMNLSKKLTKETSQKDLQKWFEVYVIERKTNEPLTSALIADGKVFG